MQGEQVHQNPPHEIQEAQLLQPIQPPEMGVQPNLQNPVQQQNDQAEGEMRSILQTRKEVAGFNGDDIADGMWSALKDLVHPLNSDMGFLPISAVEGNVGGCGAWRV